MGIITSNLEPYTDAMNDLPPDTLLNLVTSAYDLALPITIHALEDGANNRSFKVSAGNAVYILKWLHNSFVIDQLAFQNALLTALEAMNLPFAVPKPVSTRGGEAVYFGADGSRQVVLTMSAFIPGTHPGVGAQVRTRICGKGLGRLDEALAQVRLGADVSIPPAFPHLEEELAQLQESSILDSGVLCLLKSIETRWLEATAGWPQQIIHGDYFSPNVLVQDGEVSGILDFEFAGMGHRAMDLAVGLRAFCLRYELTETCWPLIEAFASGYLHQTLLSVAELNAIPILLLKRESSSFMHWLGRMQIGLTDQADLAERAERLRDLNVWVETHHSRLTALLRQISLIE